MALTAGFFFLLVAGFGYAALRVSGLRPIGALVGAIAICLLPPGFWASRLMAEGPVLASVLAAVLGVGMIVRWRGWTGAGLLTAALAAMFLTKPATGAALSVTLLVMAGALATRAVCRRGLHARAWLTVFAVTTGVALAWTVVSAAIGLPGLTETVQDLATMHFHSPDIPHPPPYLARRAAALWWHLPRVGLLPWPFLVVLLACVVIVRRLGASGVPWISVAATGFVLVTMHPLGSEYPRLVAPVWISVAVAIGTLTDLLARHLRSAGRQSRHPHGTADGGGAQTVARG
jgi:hypothetical protein